jgi:hypothetical protein
MSKLLFGRLAIDGAGFETALGAVDRRLLQQLAAPTRRSLPEITTAAAVSAPER